MANGSTLRILHCLRAPVGGLFRHVLDLARAQGERGHNVGIFADATAHDALTDQKFADIAAHLKLGIHRIAMSRKPGLGDIAAARQLSKTARNLVIDVLHGHGAKGGAYARLAGRSLRARGLAMQTFYTPHGGSLHFDPKTIEGKIYLSLEKFLARATDGLIFESGFAHAAYQERIGLKDRAVRVVPNGLNTTDFAEHSPSPEAEDFLFIGELRHLKGVDVLLRALAELNRDAAATVRIVGDGPDRNDLVNLADTLGLSDMVRFPGAEPANVALHTGKCLVVPSRAESFPYVVLEAGALAMPVIATEVGGIPEMVSGTPVKLIAAGDVAVLTAKLRAYLDDPQSAQTAAAAFKAKIARTYTVDHMAGAILDFYAEQRRNARN